MRIGIDFDNTIVNYDGVFYNTAIQLGWMPSITDHSKSAVKNYFVSAGQEPRWTELQGIVYGRDISNAKPYAGVASVLKFWRNIGHELFVVSHKTRYPIIGDKLDFHQAATNWLQQQDLMKFFNSVYYCPEKTAKIAKIDELKLNYFVDDLVSIIADPDFPASTIGILFAPNEPSNNKTLQVARWLDLLQPTSKIHVG